MLIVDEVLGHAAAKIVRRREWVGGMMGSTVDIVTIGGCAANTPKGPLSVA